MLFLISIKILFFFNLKVVFVNNKILISPILITFQLDYSNETLEVYPYKFTLKIKYTLLEDRVITSYTVINKDNREIFFSIGAHPAFMCPIKPSLLARACSFI